MRITGRFGRSALLLVVAVAVAAVTVFVVLRVQRPPSGDSGVEVAKDRYLHLPVGAGVTLDAEVVRPKGSRRFPLVVLPTSLGSPLSEYHGLAQRLAHDGYEVVTYVQRGFHASGGLVDLAGEQTQRDVSRVIDWTLAHEPADPRRIGAFGTSYGGGVSLLAAARDPRIRAVVATSTWVDLGAALAPGRTVSTFALPTLLGNIGRTGRPDPDLTQLASTLRTDPERAASTLRALSPSRSPSSVVGQLDANRPAIMIVNGFEDSILPPDSLVPFFEKLRVPKRLQLGPGDHGGIEATGLTGQPNDAVTAARRWLDHYVKGVDNGVQDDPAVQLTDPVTGEVHDFASWPSRAATLALGDPGSARTLTPGRAARWTYRLGAGVDSTASTVAAANPVTTPYRSPTARMPALQSRSSATWSSAVAGVDTLLLGQPSLDIAASSSSGSATLFAYLYDVNPAGTGTLLGMTPCTVSGARASRSTAFDLFPIAWTLRPGHRLALVIDTVDPRWHATSGRGTVVTLASTPSAPALLHVIARRGDS